MILDTFHTMTNKLWVRVSDQNVLLPLLMFMINIYEALIVRQSNLFRSSFLLVPEHSWFSIHNWLHRRNLYCKCLYVSLNSIQYVNWKKIVLALIQYDPYGLAKKMSHRLLTNYIIILSNLWLDIPKYFNN